MARPLWARRRPLDLTQIRYFLTLARTLNFTRAAEKANITQPALTRAIQKLEDELGGPLLLRERSLTQLTDLGRAMLPLFQNTLDAADAVRARAAQHRKQEDPVPMRLGFAPSVPVTTVLPALQEVTARVQGLELTLRRDLPASLVQALLEGHLDVAVLPETEPLPERLNRWRLWAEHLHLLAPEGHDVIASNAVPLAALGQHPVAAPDGAAATALDRLRASHGLSVSSHAGSGAEEIVALVSLGLGLGLVPAGVTAMGTVSRPLDPAVEHPVVLSTVAGRPMNRAVAALVKLARAKRWEEPAPAAA